MIVRTVLLYSILHIVMLSIVYIVLFMRRVLFWGGFAIALFTIREANEHIYKPRQKTNARQKTSTKRPRVKINITIVYSRTFMLFAIRLVRRVMHARRFANGFVADDAI